MKEQQDYIRDIADMRTMMERSARFLSLSGMAGIMAGIYALIGAYIAYQYLDFDPEELFSGVPTVTTADISDIILLGIVIFLLAIGTAFYLSYRKAIGQKEKFWNPTSRRLLVNMLVPLFAGGILILILISKGLTGLLLPLSLVFYGLALYNAGKFTYSEIKTLGLVEIGLGLISTYFIEHSLILWAVGFGVVHIIYGIYMHYRYER